MSIDMATTTVGLAAAETWSRSTQGGRGRSGARARAFAAVYGLRTSRVPVSITSGIHGGLEVPGSGGGNVPEPRPGNVSPAASR